MPSTTPAATLAPEHIQSLRQRAAEAARNAYAPYSHFRVGAAVLLETGEIVCGCNVENVSYRLTSCAEQAAITRAVAEYGPRIRVIAVAIANADPSRACQPCGACRQTIAEFAAGACPVYFPASGGQPGECTLGDLLPASFGARSLQPEV